ncbi:MAG: NVEALA domain-containing protein [Bacteroides sp.]|nr:NVEALA domain-containing protein [Bacteroides sp.]
MKRITKLLVVALVTGGGIYSLYSSHAQSELSELALANVDALAQLSTNDCAKRQNSVCYGIVVTPEGGTLEGAKGWVNRGEEM